MLTTLLIFLLTLSVLVIIHELGHFLAAKSIGVSVEKFAIGFPPKIWSKKVGETEYAVNLLPLGGYVSLRGENDPEDLGSKDSKNLQSRSSLEHLYIFVAGVFLNFILGIMLFWFVFIVGAQPILDDMPNYKGVINTQKVIVTEVEKDTPAEREGIQKNDKIVEIDGKKVYTDTTILSTIRSKIGADGTTVNLVIERNGEKFSKNISTYKSKVQTSSGKEVEINRIGIVLKNEGNIKANPIVAFKIAVLESFRVIKLTFLGLTNLFTTLFTQFKLSSDVSGPIGIYVATGYFVELGFIAIIQFMAVLSLTLALFNILPIPALDGGQMFFTLIEMVVRRKFSNKAKSIIQLVGFGLLISLIIAVTIKDVIRFDLIGSILNIFKR